MKNPIAPSVNYHILKGCNMKCKFCFATFIDVPNVKIDLSNSLQIIQQLRSAGFSKLNIVGGEPTLVKQLPEILAYAKSIGFVTSIVTNGALLAKDDLFESLSSHLDWIGLSIDSVNNGINRLSGRHLHSQATLDRAFYSDLSKKIKSKGIKLKINSVVSSFNKDDVIADFIDEVRPDRWKLMQAMLVEGQNSQDTSYLISDQDYRKYIMRNQTHIKRLNPIEESSELIRGSYIMINPEGRFFDSESGKHQYSDPILEVGVAEAIGQIHFNNDRFLVRGGIYKW